MKCTSCSHENNATALFCENCGNPMRRSCPACGESVTASAKFCANCGRDLGSVGAPATERLTQLQQAAPAPLQKKILSTRAQMTGERKQVTVMFADIVGSTAHAERLDPEDWSAIVTGAHQRVSDAVYRYEGTIAQLLGDGVLVFFGAPVAHEDDPERAVRAALDILDSIKEYARELRGHGAENLEMRIGLNTGLVVVGNIGNDLHVEYLAIGDTVNLAARMQSAAEPGTVLINASTARLVRHVFDLESRGELQLKGKSETVSAFRVAGTKAIAGSARGIKGLDSPIVGREHEMQLLQSRIRELLDQRGSIVSIMGEAGLGKSRLVSEVVMHSGHTFARYEGRSLSYSATTPYGPFIDALTRLYDLKADAGDAASYAKIGNPYIASMLGVKFGGEDFERVKYLEPPLLRENIFASVVTLFETLCQREPTALILEDLHWADTNSLDLLERLMPLTERAPLLIVAAFRPQRQEPSWRFHEAAARDFAHRYTAIMLEPLDETQSRQLVANLLTIEDLPERVRALILARAEGNPFFVEEVIRSLLDAQLVVRDGDRWRATREIATISLPDTLAGVIQARLDRLDEHTKRTAQTAAVIGREFDHDVLSVISEEAGALDASIFTLQRRELIREKISAPSVPSQYQAEPSRSGHAYLFKHVLTQEAAYNSLLLSRRREIHRRAAECLQRLHPTFSGEIARHFIEAHEPQRALPYLVASAEQAASAYATPEALVQFTRALEIARNSSDIAMARRAYEGLGNALTYGGNPVSAMEIYVAMEAFAREHEDVSMRVSALNKASLVQGLFFAQLDEAETKLNESERLARSCGDNVGLAESYMMRCNVGVAKADFVGLVGHLDTLVVMGKSLGNDHSAAFGLVHSANAWTFLARFDKAWDAGLAAMQFSRDRNDRQHLSDTLAFSLSWVYLSWGEIEAAQASAKEGARIAAEIGNAYGEWLGLLQLGYIARLQGEYEYSITCYQDAIRAGRMSGYPFAVGAAISGLCSTQVAAGRHLSEHVSALSAQAQQILDGPMGFFCAGVMWADLGDFERALGNLEAAARHTHNGLTRSNTYSNLMRPRLLINEAREALLREDCDSAASSVALAREHARKHSLRHDMPMIELEAGNIALQRNDPMAALAQFELAEQLALPMNLRPVIWHARAGAALALEKLGRSGETLIKRNSAEAMQKEITGLVQHAG